MNTCSSSLCMDARFPFSFWQFAYSGDVSRVRKTRQLTTHASQYHQNSLKAIWIHIILITWAWAHVICAGTNLKQRPLYIVQPAAHFSKLAANLRDGLPLRVSSAAMVTLVDPSSIDTVTLVDVFSEDKQRSVCNMSDSRKPACLFIRKAECLILLFV